MSLSPIVWELKFAVADQNLTDVSFTGKRSFLTLGPVESETTKLNVEFELRPLTNKGIVLFVGRQASFLSLLLHSGFLELTLLAGMTATSKQTVNHVPLFYSQPQKLFR